ncbi:DNase I-like protein [Thelephora ganbajun]|uniref:DNase I-like protein n=1 Tax=Thelephora ganbajun TaxID=370292 RepID=A0ACB6ZYA3_THEGA|nr:DNase I-like protein [Thelephora ganbajun]
MADSQLRICTLNCWGLAVVSKYRKERVAAIAQALSDSSYDIVALQELWVYSDYELVKAKVVHRFPYAKFFHGGALGAGLVFLSRFPIVGATSHPYSLTGSPLDALGGDWFVGKAAVSVLLAHPILGQLQVFNTHLYARGGESGPEYLRAHRLVNAWELAKLVRQSAEGGRYVISVGDFNSVPTSFPVAIIKDHSGLRDAWADTHPNAPETASPNMAPLDAIHTFGVTADSPLNTYSAGKPLDGYARQFMGKRLDYVLYRPPIHSLGSSRSPVLEPMQSDVVFTEHVPGKLYSFSDHFGLEATFSIKLPGGQPGDVNNLSDIEAPAPAPDNLTENPSQEVSLARNLEPNPHPGLSDVSITTLIQALTTCYRLSRSSSRFHLSLFFGSLFAVIGLIIGSAWLPYSWINPIFLLATTALAWLATTMLYVGFLYENYEANTLVNIIEELELYRGNIRSD